MTSPQGCDGCQDEIDLFAVSNRDTGHAQFLGPLCLAMFGATMLIGTSTEVADAAFKGLGYQPTPATKNARKDAEGPEFDGNRTIATVVESGPREDGDESVSEPGDESASGLVDKPTESENEGMDECPACGLMVKDSEQEAHYMREHVPAPPY